MSLNVVRDLLKGYEVKIEDIQSVGNMSVIPIVANDEFSNVAEINEVNLVRDPNYDQMVFKNSSGEVGITLQGWAIMDEQKAQDRTLPYAHLIKKGSQKTLPANCIQSSQGGTFNVGQLNLEEFSILPPTLRGIALQKASYTESETGALWDDLGKWSSKLNLDCKGSGLSLFYKTFQDKLDQFVAQFEIVPNQVGAIVLINGEVIAIDVLPKYSHWKAAWRAFIRDSYGAEALRLLKESGNNVDLPAIEMASIQDNSLESLEEAFNNMKSTFVDTLRAQVGDVLNASIEHESLDSLAELNLLKVENNSFQGQAVLHGDQHFVYLSFVTKKATPKAKKIFRALPENPYNDSTFRF